MTIRGGAIQITGEYLQTHIHLPNSHDQRRGQIQIKVLEITQ